MQLIHFHFVSVLLLWQDDNRYVYRKKLFCFHKNGINIWCVTMYWLKVSIFHFYFLCRIKFHLCKQYVYMLDEITMIILITRISYCVIDIWYPSSLNHRRINILQLKIRLPVTFTILLFWRLNCIFIRWDMQRDVKLNLVSRSRL